MSKSTGKAVSLVLALALAVSSFSGTFAFAAKKTVNAYDVGFGYDKDVVLVKDSNNSSYKFNLMDYLQGIDLSYIDNRQKKTENITATSDDVKVTVRHSSGKSLLSFKNDSDNNDTPMIRVKKDETGEEVVRVYAEATVDLDDGTTAVVKGNKEFTIKVMGTEDRFVAFMDDVPKGGEVKGTDDMGTPGDLEFTVDDNTVRTVDIYKAVAHDDDAFVHYERTANDKDGNVLYIDGKSNSKVDVAAAPFTVIGTDGKTYQTSKGIKHVFEVHNAGDGRGTLKLNIKNLKKSGDIFKASKTIDSTDVAVLKKIKVNGDVSVTKESGKTKLNGAAVVAGGYKHFWDSNLSGYDIAGPGGTGTITLRDGVSVGKISNFKNVNIGDKAKTGDISDIAADGIVTIDDSSSSVGTIDGIDGGVKLQEGRVAKIDAAGSIEINGGTVTGDVIGGDGTVKVDATDDDVNTVIGGQIEAKDLEIDSSTDATVKIAKVKMKDDSKAVLSGENVTIDTFNADYEGDVEFNDFNGKLSNLVQPDEVTVTSDSVVTVKGDVVATSVDADEDTSIEFQGVLTVDSLSGDGKLVVGADKLMIEEDASSNLILKLAGNNVNVGDVAYKADKDASVDVDSFNGFGFTVEKKSLDKNTNQFLVKSVAFAGLALDKTELSIAKDYSDTVTVSNYPASTSLPTGAKIVWDYTDADSDVFEVVENGATVTIKVIGFDTSYATSNEFELTATVVDENGDALEDFDSATAKITAIAEPVLSCDLNGIIEVPQGSIKNFTFTSQAVATPSLGNGAVAITGTVSPWADGKATYAVKATGAVGTTTGVYANIGGFSKQVFTVKVTAPVVTVDTTVDFALAKGNRYVYKVTAPATPNFTVGNGSVLKTQAGKVVGNDYYFAVYAIGNAGQSTGVYVNGVKVNNVTIK